MSKIDQQEFQYRLLTDANEDHTNLCEALWETLDVEQTTIAEKYSAAELALRQLLGRGWIRLYRTDDGQQYEVIASVDVDAVLAHPNSWFPLYPDFWTAFGATEEGRRVWQSGEFRRH